MNDLQNYFCYAPVYLCDKYRLQEKDPDTWQFFPSGNVPVNKTKISLPSIGVYHALGQENRKMKVLGGIKKTGNNQAAQDQYFLIASEINEQ